MLPVPARAAGPRGPSGLVRADATAALGQWAVLAFGFVGLLLLAGARPLMMLSSIVGVCLAQCVVPRVNPVAWVILVALAMGMSRWPADEAG